MIVGLAAMLVLHPVVHDPTDVRLATSDTAGLPVAWVVDGQAPRVSAEPIRWHLGSGWHEVSAITEYTGTWTALVRQEPSEPGLSYVPAWAAQHPASLPAPVPLSWEALAACCGAAMLARRRHSKGP